MLELIDEGKPVEESHQAHHVELSLVDVPSLVTEIPECVPVRTAVKKCQDTGLVVSENSFEEGVVSVADLGTTLDEIELAKQCTVGVIGEVTPITNGTFARWSLLEAKLLSVDDNVACVVQAIDFKGIRVVVGLRGAATGYIQFTDLTDKLLPFREDYVKRGVIVNAAIIETGDKMLLSGARSSGVNTDLFPPFPGGDLADL